MSSFIQPHVVAQWRSKTETKNLLKNGCHSGYLSQTNSQLACGSIRVEFGLSCRILSFSLSHRATRQKKSKNNELF